MERVWELNLDRAAWRLFYQGHLPCGEFPWGTKHADWSVKKIYMNKVHANSEGKTASILVRKSERIYWREDPERCAMDITREVYLDRAALTFLPWPSGGKDMDS